MARDKIKRFYRSRDDKIIAGVGGGLAEYFNIDPTLVRLFLVLIAFATGGGAILVYLITALIAPEAPRGAKVHEQ